MTYLELYEARLDDELRNRVTTATTVAVETLMAKATPTADEWKYAISVSQAPRRYSLEVLAILLARDKDTSLAALKAATDAQIQTRADGIVDEMVLGYAALGNL